MSLKPSEPPEEGRPSSINPRCCGAVLIKGPEVGRGAQGWRGLLDSDMLQ